MIVRRLGQEAPQTGRAWTRDERYAEPAPFRCAVMLVDTTVLVSAHDPRDRPKPERALGVLDRLIGSGRAVLSARCRSECFVVAPRACPRRWRRRRHWRRPTGRPERAACFDVTAAVLEGCQAARTTASPCGTRSSGPPPD